MNKRIRYYEKDAGLFVSVRTVKTPSGDVLIKYYGENLLVLIVNANEPDVVLDTFTSTTLHSMKKEIKAKLIGMGAVFAPETRNRGAGEQGAV